jgi:hypothetical protein
LLWESYRSCWRLDAYDLLEICKFDFRRIDESGGFKEFLGFQRKLDLKRVREIEQYIQTVDAVFPTAIVISVDDRCATFEKGILAIQRSDSAKVSPAFDRARDSINYPITSRLAKSKTWITATSSTKTASPKARPGGSSRMTGVDQLLCHSGSRDSGCPESILPMLVMDSGLAPSSRPGMTSAAPTPAKRCEV